VTLLLVLACAVCGGCEGRVTTGVKAQQAESPLPDAPLFLEFDLPDEFSDRTAAGEDVVTGIRVGYFRPGDTEPFSTVTISRDEVVVNGETGRVPVDRERAMGGALVRLQTVTRAASSSWSDAPSFSSGAAGVGSSSAARSAPPSAAAAGTPVRAVGGTNRRSRVRSADVEAYPQLLSLANEMRPGEVAFDDMLAPFRSVTEFALALVICRDHQIPFETFIETMNGPPQRTLRPAVQELRAMLKGANVIAAARDGAEQLLVKADSRK
jgi:hypothetical protein